MTVIKWLLFSNPIGKGIRSVKNIMSLFKDIIEGPADTSKLSSLLPLKNLPISLFDVCSGTSQHFHEQRFVGQTQEEGHLMGPGPVSPKARGSMQTLTARVCFVQIPVLSELEIFPFIRFSFIKTTVFFFM